METKPIKGYENYHITEYGDIIRKERWINNQTNQPIRFKKDRPQKKFITEKGYLRAFLYKDGTRKRKCFRIHRLVAMMFIPNPFNLPEINHKDGNKQNNHYSNLEWCTHKHNCQHAVMTGLSRGKAKIAA